MEEERRNSGRKKKGEKEEAGSLHAKVYTRRKLARDGVVCGKRKEEG